MQHITNNQHTIDVILFCFGNKILLTTTMIFSFHFLFILFFFATIQYGDCRLYLAQEECFIHTVLYRLTSPIRTHTLVIPMDV